MYTADYGEIIDRHSKTFSLEVLRCGERRCEQSSIGAERHQWFRWVVQTGFYWFLQIDKVMV